MVSRVATHDLPPTVTTAPAASDESWRLAPFDALDPYVQALSGIEGPVYVKPYDGNAGDELIWHGTLALLDSLGVERTLDPRAAAVILSPGGNPTLWPSNAAQWTGCLESYPSADLLLGPMSVINGVHDWPRRLARDAERVLAVFARDDPGWERLQKSGLPARIPVGLSHDPAWALRDSAWMSEHRAAATEEFVLAAFRGDREQFRARSVLDSVVPRLPGVLRGVVTRMRSSRVVSQRVRELTSEFGRASVNVLDVSRLRLEMMIETVRRATLVCTDRLHVMILALMLAKPVRAYPASFGKLRAVWERSGLATDRVEFVDPTAAR